MCMSVCVWCFMLKGTDSHRERHLNEHRNMQATLSFSHTHTFPVANDVKNSFNTVFQAVSLFLNHLISFYRIPLQTPNLIQGNLYYSYHMSTFKMSYK